MAIIKYVKMLFLIWALLSIVPLANSYLEHENSIRDSYKCDDDDGDEAQKTIVYKIDLLDTTIENIKHKLDTFNLKIDRKFGDLKATVAVINSEATETGTNNTGCYSYSYWNLIDVRWAGNEPCDTEMTTTTTSPKPTAQLLNSSPISSTLTSIPSNCRKKRQDGLQLIQIPNNTIDPFYIFCVEEPQQDDGAPWMLIQRRRNGKTDFYRNWRDYQLGFGNLENEYFIGLDKLHALTHSALHELWIQLEDFSNETRWAKYSSFAIGNASEFYVLKTLGSYTGNAGDALTLHVGQNFTTKDVDNDLDNDNNCAQTTTGAWWYKDCLYKSNLNGKYFGESYAMLKISKGIEWEPWHGYYYSLKYVHMAIRPQN